MMVSNRVKNDASLNIYRYFYQKDVLQIDKSKRETFLPDAIQ